MNARPAASGPGPVQRCAHHHAGEVHQKEHRRHPDPWGAVADRPDRVRPVPLQQQIALSGHRVRELFSRIVAFEYLVHPDIHNANFDAEVEGPRIELSAGHAKVRRDGYCIAPGDRS